MIVTSWYRGKTEVYQSQTNLVHCPAHLINEQGNVADEFEIDAKDEDGVDYGDSVCQLEEPLILALDPNLNMQSAPAISIHPFPLLLSPAPFSPHPLHGGTKLLNCCASLWVRLKLPNFNLFQTQLGEVYTQMLSVHFFF